MASAVVTFTTIIQTVEHVFKKLLNISSIHSSPIHIHIAVLVLTSHLTYWNFAPEKPNIHHWVAVLQKKTNNSVIYTLKRLFLERTV